MRALCVVFAVTLMAVFAAQISVNAQRAPAASNRQIKVKSEPSATVWLNGVSFGRTDKEGVLEIKNAPAGSYTIKVRAAGFKEFTKPLLPAQKGLVEIALVKTTDEAELAFQEAERLAYSDRERSAEAYNKAIRLRPNYVDAYIGLARVLSEAQDIEGAATAIRSARKLKPGNAEASAVEGRIYKDSGEEAKAIAAFKRAITEGRGFQPEAYAGLGLLYKEKAEGSGGSGDIENEEINYTEAAKNLRSCLKQLSGAPDAIVIYQLLGLVYERQKKHAEAIAVYEEFLRFFPNSAEATAVRSFIVQLKKDQLPQN